MKYRQIGHTTSQYGQSFSPKSISAWNGLAFAEAPSLAVFRSNCMKNLRASFPHNTLEGSCGKLNQNRLLDTPSAALMNPLPYIKSADTLMTFNTNLNTYIFIN